jgi:hypothetical protein
LVFYRLCCKKKKRVIKKKKKDYFLQRYLTFFSNSTHSWLFRLLTKVELVITIKKKRWETPKLLKINKKLHFMSIFSSLLYSGEMVRNWAIHRVFQVAKERETRSIMRIAMVKKKQKKNEKVFFFFFYIKKGRGVDDNGMFYNWVKTV